MLSRCRFYGNGKNSPDTLNNNEKIIINNPKKGTYRVPALLVQGEIARF